MKEIKEFIYETLSADEEIKKLTWALWDEENIFFLWWEKQDIPEWSSFIFYSRISEKTNKTWKRVSIFQISVWSEDSLKCEKLKDRVVKIFNRSQYEPYFHCSLENVSEDTYDSEIKAYWINLTFIFIAKDQTF